MSDPNDALLPIAAAAKRHPDTRCVSPRTVIRWATRGVRGVKLEARRVGGRFHCSVAAISRFVEALNPTSATADQPRSPHERNRASEAAAEELAKAGC